MAWRNIHIANPAFLRLKHNTLSIQQKDQEEITIACEDIACLILDTPEVTLTAALLSKFCALGIAVIVPDHTHHPAGMLLSFHQHYAQAEMTHLQIKMSEPFKKRLWQKLIQQKILNQAFVLENYGTEEGKKKSKTMKSLALMVKSGDPQNIEAQAARLYWQNLLKDFRRADNADYRNSLLNYGYAIARASLARAIVAAGLLPSLGVHHCSKLNAFNLVDDVIEVFRPMVDAHMMAFLAEQEEREEAELTLADRRYMTTILDIPVMFPNIGQQNFLTATETLSYALAKSIKGGGKVEIALPYIEKGW